MNYFLISLKHSTPKELYFWKPDAAGYTDRLDLAGKYSKDEILTQPDYYNDGINVVAVPCNEMHMAGIKIQLNFSPGELKEYAKKHKMQNFWRGN